MRNFIYVVLMIVVASIMGCSSDSDSSTSEEKELRTLLNNEWEAIEWEKRGLYERKNSDRGPLTKEEIDTLLDESWLMPFSDPYTVILGMNKKGEIYYLLKHDEKNYPIENPIIDFLYVATKQKDNVFTGCFNYLTEPDKEIEKRSFYIRKIDENTIKVTFIYAESNRRPEHTEYFYSTFLMKKKGSWDESITVKKLLERYNFEPNFIEMMGGDRYEKEVAERNCQ